MSRSARWKAEKTKVKVVFRLQFHATHIPQTGWDKLYISFIPADSGKTTAKTTKANVRNGTCKWADPIYETARLLQDIRTKQYDEKLYKLVVAMGSSRSSILGETTINLADYVDASKPSAVALPLHGYDTGAILHVTVQLLTSKTGFREFEQQRELRERGLQTGTDQASSVSKLSSSEDVFNSQMDKVSARVRFKEKSEDQGVRGEDASLNDEYVDSAVGLDGSSNTSESVYADKHDTSSAHEIDSQKSTVSGDLAGVSQNNLQEKGDNHLLARGSHDWVHGWSSDCSVDNDFALVYEENNRLRGCLEVAESSIQELKLEVSSLQNYADEIGVEMQKLAQQLASEIASEEQLVAQVSVLKSECSKLKDDLEKTENHKLHPPFPCDKDIKKDRVHLFHDLEVTWLKGLSAMEEKVRELQNKACLGYHERDIRFLHSDIEALLEILQVLRRGTASAISGHNSSQMSFDKHGQYVLGMDLGVEPELSVLPCISMPGVLSPEPDSLDTTNEMKNKIFELLRELDESKAERENLAKKMDQMECYYEALVQELEENQRQMLGELQSLRNEHSTCLYVAQSAKAEMETMRHRLDEQILRFAEDKQDLDSLNKELERRAITAEAALKRARLNYSIAVGQLQKDLELLSFQVLSLFETNENLIKQAYTDSSQPSLPGYSQVEPNQKLDSKNYHARDLIEFQDQFVEAKKHHLSRDNVVEDLRRSLYLQESLYQKVEDEAFEMLSLTTYLDVFSKTLEETLCDAKTGMRLRKESLNEVTRKLELSLKSEELLMQRLQTAMNDIKSLNDCKATCISKYDDMALQKQILEASLQNVTQEKQLYQQKITELEPLIIEYQSYKSKYEACVMEKVELANLLNIETLENSNLKNDVSSLKAELKIVRDEYDEIIAVHQNLKNTVDILQNKLQNLMAGYDKSLAGLSIWEESISWSWECKDLPGSLSHLEKLQNKACEKILQLLKEKNEAMDGRNEAQASLSKVQTDMIVMKQKTEHEVRHTVLKLDASSELVKKLELDIEGIAEKLKLSSEVEQCHVQQQGELLSDLEHFEVELQQLFAQNREFAEEILALESVNGELENSKLIVAELTDQNKALTESLEHQTKESSKLAFELNSSRETLLSLLDELQTERNSKDNLESKVTELSSQISEIQCQLLQLEQQKSEINYLKQIISDIESEKSRVCHLLLQSEERLKAIQEESSSSIGLESQLSEMQELSIAADISLIFFRTQCEDWTEDLEQQLFSSERHLMEFRRKYLEVEKELNGCLAREAKFIEENAGLFANLHSLKSELEVSVAKSRELLNKNSILTAELEECKDKLEKMEIGYIEDKSQHDFEVEKLKHLLVSTHEDFDNLMLLKEELEINGLLLKAKLNEQHDQITLLEGYSDKVMLLQDQCNDLSQRLSEQILKTEEFKNLTIHLKELKDKAEAECIRAREKKESEGPMTAVQESLRIAFIKEQYETRVQELKHQLAVSKKHSEEMLLKLQDAVDEIENRRKSEASHLKRNEELGMKILELEAELQSVISEKREKTNAYDRMKAELECSLISMECCKEEKQKLEASLQECNEEKSKISAELSMVKELLHTSTSIKNVEDRDESLVHSCISDEAVGISFPHNTLVSCTEESVNLGLIQSNGQTRIPVRTLGQNNPINCEEEEYIGLATKDEGFCPDVSLNLQHEQDLLVANDTKEIKSLELVKQGEALNGDAKQLAIVNGKAQSLRISMDQLNSELERMKNENLLLAQEGDQFDTKFPELHRELSQLNKVNEELESIFPVSMDYSGSGNALERVLALELELAEALQNKKKSSSRFQSSFLKQHNDEEAIFKSFRDINELIKDMLDVKERYTFVETELKEMHERYSQLSLQFAEVEGERQKLIMTLKSVRASRKALHLNRSSSTTIGEQS